ncbi:MAG: Gfo/Idh/MocA family oxidoreductase [Lentisphaeria bacterium]|nr:Gfo/Idh/MocA family oxidoreductase [Lentisphaeria bacterium]
MINVAIVGIGGIGNIHAGCYENNKHTKLVAVCDIIKEKADAAAEKYGVKAFYSVKSMLKSDLKIDACSVTTAGVENGGDHYKPSIELLNAGMPILGEKPISNEIAKARKLVETAKKKRVSYGVNLNHRFTPSAIRAKEWIKEGRLGDLNIINLTMWINNPNESSPHFHMRALHPHSFDIMRYFAGDIDKVQAFFKKGKGRKIWSNVQVNLQFKNGMIGHLTGSYDAGGSYGMETCEIVGSEGRVIINEACEKLSFYPRFSKEVEIYDHLGGMGSFGETFQSRINAWIEDLRKKTAPSKVDAKAEDALKVQLVIESCIKSWETGNVIKVPQK